MNDGITIPFTLDKPNIKAIMACTKPSVFRIFVMKNAANVMRGIAHIVNSLYMADRVICDLTLTSI